MEIDLRPLTLGEILDRTFQLYRGRFVMFVGIATVAAAIRMAWQALDSFGSRMLLTGHVAPALLGSITTALAFVTLGVMIVALSLTLAATTRAVTAIYLGSSTGVAQAYSEVRGQWFRYVRLNLTAFLIAWSPALLVLAMVVVSVGMAAKMKTLGTANAIATVFGATGLVFFVAVPLGVWLTLRYSLANAAGVFENIGVAKALKRSVALSKDTRGRIFLMMLIVVVAESMFSVLFMVPIFPLLVKHPGHIPLWVTIYTLAISFVINSLTMPIYGIGLTLFYYDARIRKEGFDVEWMLERTLPAEPPLAEEDQAAVTVQEYAAEIAAPGAPSAE